MTSGGSLVIACSETQSFERNQSLQKFSLIVETA